MKLPDVVIQLVKHFVRSCCKRFQAKDLHEKHDEMVLCRRSLSKQITRPTPEALQSSLSCSSPECTRVYLHCRVIILRHDSNYLVQPKAQLDLRTTPPLE